MRDHSVTTRDVNNPELAEMPTAGSLIAGVAHQVRNPLFNISSTLDIMEAICGNGADVQEYLPVLKREVHRLNDLMQGILEYSKLHIRELSEGNIQDVIAQAIRACALLAERSNVKIANSAQGGLPPLLMDRKHLTQAFVNLLENAVQHSPPGRVITVEAKEIRLEREVWIECAIKDTGRGFPVEDLPMVFAPFFTRRRGGVGLGLAIVQRIVEEHSGKAWVGNRPEGGAIAKVILRSTTTD